VAVSEEGVEAYEEANRGSYQRIYPPRADRVEQVKTRRRRRRRRRQKKRSMGQW